MAQRANPRTPPDAERITYASGPPLSRGSLVMFSGGVLALAAVTDDDAFDLLGVVSRDVVAGEVAVVGVGSRLALLVRTGEAPAVGSRLFLSTEAGKATTVLPTAGNLIEVGVALNVDDYAADGIVYTRFSWKESVEL